MPASRIFWGSFNFIFFSIFPVIDVGMVYLNCVELPQVLRTCDQNLSTHLYHQLLQPFKLAPSSPKLIFFTSKCPSSFPISSSTYNKVYEFFWDSLALKLSELLFQLWNLLVPGITDVLQFILEQNIGFFFSDFLLKYKRLKPILQSEKWT
jgi:hypothetical protein